MTRLRELVLASIVVALFAPPSAVAADPPWLQGPSVLVQGEPGNHDCRLRVCKHNENTDMIRWRGAIWLAHRTAESQVLGPNSSLRILRSTDGGQTFQLEAVLPAPGIRDIRDPSFYVVGDRLFIKAIARLPGFLPRDIADSVSVETHSPDGKTWTGFRDISPHGWGFWRVVEHDGVYYSAAYQDGDLQVVLYTSRDGLNWKPGPQIYGRAEDTPLETELVLSPSGEHMLALVRMDGYPLEILGSDGRLRTKICWARRPFTNFTCPQEFLDVRLDGPVAWYWEGGLFLLARRHIPGPGVKKRTTLYEIEGKFEGGPLRLREWGDLPSAGDTSYAGIAHVAGSRFVATWYSSPPGDDPSWTEGLFGKTDIWRAHVDLAQLPGRTRPRRSCLAHGTGMSARRIGGIRLGASRAALERLPVAPARRNGGSYRYCVAGRRGRVTAVLSRHGRVALVASTVHGHRLRGVGRGAPAIRIRRAYPHGRSLGRGLRGGGARSRALFGLRRGRVRFVAIADRALLRDRARVRRAVRNAGL